MRSFFVLILLAVVLASIALVVRSGIFSRENPGQPINAAMRTALGDKAHQWSDRDTQLIAQHYNGARDTPGGLRYLVRQPGTGDATVQHGQLVTFHYEGRLLESGQVFDTSAKHKGPFNFRIGEGSVPIQGWVDGILGMKKGEKRTLIVPYWLAYGEKGIRGKIPPHATLVFDIELLKFE
ncbi:MAG: peptidylprolyl isomerase [Rariglobus sp.]|jgi:FKBP-type peptidyl-prolyl cis-trans isomerase|nr:peptidylprolyl isomerase [Rariglobus sp.]